MRKRYIVAGVLVALLMVAVVAAACSGTTTTTAAPTTTSAAPSSTTTAASTETTAAPGSTTTAAATETTVAATPATGEPIKIGLDTSLTGAGAAPAKTFDQGIQAQIDNVNANGGINGRPLQLVMYDDKTDVPTCVANLNKLVQQDKVFATIGPFAQFMQEPARQIAEQYKVPMVGPGPATLDQLKGKQYQWSVMVAAGAPPQADAYEKMITGFGWKNVLGLADVLTINQEDLQLIGQAASAQGYKFTLMPDTVSLSQTDFQPVLNKIMQQIETVKPDAIILAVNVVVFPSMYKGLRGLGVTLPIVAGTSCAHPAIFAQGPEAVEGAYIPDNGGNANPQGLPDTWSIKPLQLAFDKIYQAKYNTAPDFFAAEASDLVTVLVAGMKQAGTLDQAKVAQALVNLKDLPALQGPVTFTPTADSMGATQGNVVLWQLKNGQFTFVKDLN